MDTKVVNRKYKIDNLDSTPTGQSYFDNQRAGHKRIIENCRKLMERQEKNGVKALFYSKLL